jgi:hypothetical protein
LNKRYLILFCLAFLSLSGNSQIIEPLSNSSDLLPVIKNMKWGFIDKTGKIIVEPYCDGFSEFNSSGYAYVFMGDKKGIIFRKGNTVIKPVYTDIKFLDAMYFAVYDGKNWGIYNNNGYKIIDNLYPKLNYLKNHFFTFTYDSLYGLLNGNGKVISVPKYDEYRSMDFPEYFLTIRKKLLGLIDTVGNILIECKYNRVRLLNNHFAAFSSDSSHWTGINLDDKTIIDDNWSYIKNCTPYIGFQKNDEWTLYSTKEHKLYHSIKCDDIDGLDNRYAMIRKNAKLGVIDTNSNTIIPTFFDTIIYLPGRGFLVDSMNYWGLYGLDGRKIIPPSLSGIYPERSNQYFFVGYFNSFYGLYRYNGQVIYPLIADEIQLFRDRVKIYQNTNLTILEFDSNGLITDSLKFENIHRISVIKSDFQIDLTPSVLRNFKGYGWFLSEKNGRWGIKDSNSKVMINPLFNDVIVLNNQYSIVMNQYNEIKPELWLGNGKADIKYYYGIVDHKKYKIITRPQFLDIRNDFANGCNVTRVITNTNNHFGLLYKSGYLKTKDISYVGEFSDSMACINIKGVIGERNPDSKNSTIESKTLLLNNLRFSTENNRLNIGNSIIIISGGYWGYINQEGKIAVPAVYTRTKDFKNGKAIVAKDEKWGVIDKKNNTIVAFDYDRIELVENSGDSFFRLINNVKEKGIINSSGKITLRPKFDDFGYYSENLVKVKIGNKWGFADATGKVVINAIYRDVHDFREGRAAVKVGRKWGYIDTSGTFIVSPYYREVHDFHEGKACVYPTRRCGFIDLWGDTIILPILNNASDYKNGYCIAKKKGKVGSMNSSGKWVIHPKYSEVMPFDEYGMAIVEKRYKYGLIDQHSNKIVACRFEEIGPFSEGLAYVKKKNKYGFIDLKGRIVIPIKYDKVRSYSEGMAAVSSNSIWGFVDNKGKIIIKPCYTSVSDFHNNKAVIRYGQFYGLINKIGFLILQPIYYSIGDFSEGRALVKTTFNSGYFVDTNCKMLYSLIVQHALPYKNGIALVKVNDLWGMIDIHGNFIANPQFTMMKQISDTSFCFAIKEYTGIADLKGNIILEPVYENIKYEGDHIFRVNLNNYTGYVDTGKNWIWKPSR